MGMCVLRARVCECVRIMCECVSVCVCLCVCVYVFVWVSMNNCVRVRLVACILLCATAYNCLANYGVY